MQAAQQHPLMWCIKWNHDASMFAAGGVHTLQVFNANTFEPTNLIDDQIPSVSNPLNNEHFTATNISWHPRNNLLAVSFQGPMTHLNGVFNIETGQQLLLKIDMGRGVAWNPSGNKVAMASTGDGNLKIWTYDGKLLNNIPRYKEAKGLTGVAWDPSGKSIITIGAFITLHQSDGTPIQQIQHRAEAKERLCLLLSVAWHPSGEFFVTGDYGNEIDDPLLQFWTPEGELMKNIPLKGGAEIRNVSWNKDGTQLAIASDQLRIFDHTGKLMHQAESPDLLWGIDWHPDGDRILTTSMDGRITLWNSEAKLIKEITQITVN